jgi:hypothetical protein
VQNRFSDVLIEEIEWWLAVRKLWMLLIKTRIVLAKIKTRRQERSSKLLIVDVDKNLAYDQEVVRRSRYRNVRGIPGDSSKVLSRSSTDNSDSGLESVVECDQHRVSNLAAKRAAVEGSSTASKKRVEYGLFTGTGV